VSACSDSTRLPNLVSPAMTAVLSDIVSSGLKPLSRSYPAYFAGGQVLECIALDGNCHFLRASRQWRTRCLWPPPPFPGCAAGAAVPPGHAPARASSFDAEAVARWRQYAEAEHTVPALSGSPPPHPRGNPIGVCGPGRCLPALLSCDAQRRCFLQLILA
jgi:hypothetical protein